MIDATCSPSLARPAYRSAANMLALAKPPFNTRFNREQPEIRDRQGLPLKKYAEDGSIRAKKLSGRHRKRLCRQIRSRRRNKLIALVRNSSVKFGLERNH